MKLLKKLLVFALAAGAVVPCAIVLSACAEDTQATITNIYLKDSSDKNVSNLELGEYVYGTSSAEILPDNFTLYAEYSDGSEKVLPESEYAVSYAADNVDLTVLPDVPDCGNYSVTYTSGDFTASVVFFVIKATPSYEISVETKQWTYGSTGSDVSVPDYPGPADSSQSINWYAVEKSVFDALTDEQKTNYWTVNDVIIHSYAYAADTALLDAGQYYIYAVLPAQSQNYNESYTVIDEDCLVTVTKAQINLTADMLTSSNVNARFVYNSDSLNEKKDKIALADIELNSSLFLVYENTYINGTFEWVEPQTLVDASDDGDAFPVKFTAEGEINYEVVGSAELVVSIEKCYINNITMSVENAHDASDGYCDLPHDYVFAADDKYDVIIYSSYFHAEYIDFTYTKDNGEEQPIDTIKIVGGDWVLRGFSDVGVYTVTARISYPNNYYWFNTDGNTDPVTYTFEIVEKIELPAISFKLNDCITPESGNDYAVYDAKTRVILVEGWDNAIHGHVDIRDEEDNYLIPISGDIDGDGTDEYYLIISGSSLLAVKDAGTYTVTATPLPEDAYYWKGLEENAITYTCEVKAADIRYALYTFDEDYQLIDNDTLINNPPAYFANMEEWVSDNGGLANSLSYDADVYVKLCYDGSGEYAEFSGKASVQYAERDDMQYFGTEAYAYQTSMELIMKSAGQETAYTVSGTVQSSGNDLEVTKPYITIYSSLGLYEGAIASAVAADMPFITLNSDKLTYYAYEGDDYIKIKVVQDETRGTERSVDEVYIVLTPQGEYVGHAVVSEVYDTTDNSLKFSGMVQFRFA